MFGRSSVYFVFVLFCLISFFESVFIGPVGVCTENTHMLNVVIRCQDGLEFLLWKRLRISLWEGLTAIFLRRGRGWRVATMLSPLSTPGPQDIAPAPHWGLGSDWTQVPSSEIFFSHQLDYLCQLPGIVESVLGLDGSGLVHCDLARQQVWSAFSISTWQRVELSD